MKMTNQSDSQNNKVDKVLEKIGEIVECSAGDDYIYRGEHKLYEKVSSNLYRAYAALGVTDPAIIRKAQKKSSKLARLYLRDSTDETPLAYLDGSLENVDGIQQEVLRSIRKIVGKTRNFEILARIQHYGGKTNLIDFTTDYLIALFFACTGSDEEDGRIILLKNENTDDYKIKKMFPPISRAESQKSMFVHAFDGFIDLKEDNSKTITIPKCLKKDILEYLGCHHDISAERIYNDLHGFIRLQDIYLPIYEALYKALEWEGKGASKKDGPEEDGPEKSRRCYGEAVKIYTRILEYEPKLSGVYRRRGTAYTMMGEYDKAIENLSEAIRLNPEQADYYYSRGDAHLKKGDVKSAKDDYRDAIKLNSEELMYRIGLCLALIKGREWKKADEERRIIKDKGAGKGIDAYLKMIEAARYCERWKMRVEREEWREANEELSALENMKNYDIKQDVQEIMDFVENKKIKLPEDLAKRLNQLMNRSKTDQRRG